MGNDALVREFIDLMRRMSRTKPQHKMNGFLCGEHFIVHYLYDCVDFATPGEISEKTATSTARIAAALNSLENKGIIKREISKEDRRRILVSLTDKGRALGEEKKEEFLNHVVEMFDAIGESDSRELVRIVKKICTVVEEKEKDVDK